MNKKAFTLIELLTVMALVALLSVAGIASYRGLRRGAEMRAAQSMVRTAVVMARQQAVLLRKNIKLSFVSYSGTNSIYLTKAEDSSELHNSYTFPSSIEFGATPPPITFGASGSGGAQAAVDVTLNEKEGVGAERYPPSTITIWPLTGVTKIQ